MKNTFKNTSQHLKLTIGTAETCVSHRWLPYKNVYLLRKAVMLNVFEILLSYFNLDYVMNRPVHCSREKLFQLEKV